MKHVSQTQSNLVCLCFKVVVLLLDREPVLDVPHIRDFHLLVVRDFCHDLFAFLFPIEFDYPPFVIYKQSPKLGS